MTKWLSEDMRLEAQQEWLERITDSTNEIQNKLNFFHGELNTWKKQFDEDEEDEQLEKGQSGEEVAHSIRYIVEMIRMYCYRLEAEADRWQSYEKEQAK